MRPLLSTCFLPLFGSYTHDRHEVWYAWFAWAVALQRRPPSVLSQMRDILLRTASDAPSATRRRQRTTLTN